MPVLNRLKQAWNVFRYDEKMRTEPWDKGPSYSTRPDRNRLMIFNERSIISSIYTRISIDVAGNEIRHVEVDKDDRYVGDVSSKLNDCLLIEANLDQAPRAFRQDIAMTLLDKGVAAIVPVDTVGDPGSADEFDICTLRVGEIVAWYPQHVRVRLYNIARGERQEITLEKRFVAIVENPLYSVMNEPNSTLQRLMIKLNYLDNVDAQSSSGKLDLIIRCTESVSSKRKSG